jgi:hypothetical protein
MLPKDPRTPSHKLTFNDAVEVWNYYALGHFPHRISAHFDTDPARIYDVLKELKHVGSRQKAIEQLEKQNPALAKFLRNFKFKSKKEIDDNQPDFFKKAG